MFPDYLFLVTMLQITAGLLEIKVRCIRYYSFSNIVLEISLHLITPHGVITNYATRLLPTSAGFTKYLL